MIREYHQLVNTSFQAGHTLVYNTGQFGDPHLVSNTSNLPSLLDSLLMTKVGGVEVQHLRSRKHLLRRHRVADVLNPHVD